MQPITAPWTTWWQEDIPCRFSREDAARNCQFLTNILGPGWLQKALAPSGKHPLLSEWMTNGANAFLLLNALAEDTRLLASISGFDQILRDLRDGKRCLSAWHVIRGAAMFQRAGAAVTSFYEQTDDPVPDFSIRFGSNEGNVEAKLLTKSDLEEEFEKYAKPLQETIFTEVMAQESVHPPVTIIVKDAHRLPDTMDIVHATASLLHDSKTPPRELRSDLFNIFVGSPPSGSGLFRGCYILSPRSEKENFRVATRISKASQQLLSDLTSKRPGIFWLGMTRHQDPIYLRNLFVKRFAAGHYAGVSLAFLILSGTHLEPPRRSVIDYGSRIVNPKSRVALPSSIPVKPFDLLGDLITLYSSETGLPAYRVGAVETRHAAGMPQLRLPDIRRVQDKLLE